VFTVKKIEVRRPPNSRAATMMTAMMRTTAPMPSPRMASMACSWWVVRRSVQCGDCGVVVRLLTDLRHLLRVEDRTVRIEDDDGTGQQTGQRAVVLHETVVLAERGAEGGSHRHVLDALGTAEARLREWQVLRDAHDGRVLPGGGALIELADARGAHAGVHAGEDVEDDPGAGQALGGHVGEVGAHEGEVGSSGSDGGQLATGLDRGSTECDVSHASILTHAGG